MRLWVLILVGCVSVAVSAADKHDTHVSKHGTHVSKKDRQAAEKEFSRAMELQKSGDLDGALQAIAHAVELVPGNMEYLTAREMLREQLSGTHLSQGNRLAQAGDKTGAAAQFREALSIDPENLYAQQLLRDVAPEDPEHQQTVELLASVDQVNLAPAPGNKSIHVRGDTRSVYAQIGQAFNISVKFDDGLTSRPLRFDLDDVDFYTAMRVVGKMTQSFWAPVSSYEIIVAGDSTEMRKHYERLSVRTFYLGNAVAATDLTDITNVLRNIFEMRFVNFDTGRNAIVVRGTRESVEASALFIENVMDARPELMIDVQALEFDTNKATQYGVTLPTSFIVFNIPSEIRRVLGADAQSVINQLLQTGTINPATIPSSALANLQGSPLLAPFLFFGKGYGLTGIVANPITGTLAFNSSIASTLEHVTLRTTDGETATFRVGDRFPIAIGSFSTIAVSGQNAANLGSVPQFQYEDLGLTLKVKPHYLADDNIKIDFDLQIQGLGTASLNNVPELTNRAFKGNITVRAGEPSVVAGEMDDQATRSTHGYPGIGQVSALQPVLNNNSRQITHSQILIVVTPYVVRKPFHGRGSSVFWNVGP